MNIIVNSVKEILHKFYLTEKVIQFGIFAFRFEIDVVEGNRND